MEIIFYLTILLFSVIIHEVAHGAMAYSLGDPTAKYEDRLTLNPLKHLDLFGSVILPLFLVLTKSSIIVGWAKPVPINPYNFRDKKWGELKVAFSGPASNFIIALIFGLIIRFFNPASPLLEFLGFIVKLNLILMIFNLIPVPPLDGHWILFSLLPESFSNFKNILNQYGLLILLFIIFFGFYGINFIALFLFSLITGYSFY
jgi:Zn-dependent protease